ncbi:hypothetical protein BKA64DRAFT_639030 [Cadophora sp. MPI-SDFR-AT-0126]|nr:hypothetical protein BKA64DRAFT_639030 [Leotiomycetes sp. MPI-SDFR-AT-0126]
MMHRRAFSNDSKDNAPRSAPRQTAQPFSNQNVPAFTDRKNPFQSQSIDDQPQIMPPWNSFMAALPLHSPPADKSRSVTSDYCWSNSPLFSLQSSLDTDSSDTEYSEEYCSLFPLPPNQTSDQKDEINIPSAPSSYTTDAPLSSPFASNRFSNRSAYVSTADPEENQSQISDNESTHHKSNSGRLLEEVRVVHNQVEQRYRHRVRDNINALWSVIPESSTTIQPSKAVVLKRAKEHILELQQHARREKREKETLEAKVQMLEHFLAERPSTKGLRAQNVKYSVV